MAINFVSNFVSKCLFDLCAIPNGLPLQFRHPLLYFRFSKVYESQPPFQWLIIQLRAGGEDRYIIKNQGVPDNTKDKQGV
jgi:hypothetical protein